MSIDVTYVLRSLHDTSKELAKAKVTLAANADAAQLLDQMLGANKTNLANVEMFNLRVFKPGTTRSDWETPDEQRTAARLDPEDPLAPYTPGPEVTDKEQRRFNVIIVPTIAPLLGSTRSARQAILNTLARGNTRL